jgi:IMP dehydrogenase
MAEILPNEYLTYDDILLVPNKSLASRNSAEYGIYIDADYFAHPVIPANMDSISGPELCMAALEGGGMAILHRFMSLNQRLQAFVSSNNNPRFYLSIGVTPSERANTTAMLKAGARRFCIDIAHGHADTVVEMIKLIKDFSKDTVVIAGNVATEEGYSFLYQAGADIIKVGVGPGSHCTTRIITGCGVPQFSALWNICQYRIDGPTWGPKPLIIADGGLKYSGDITKALAVGADFVMSGSFFAGCDEAPGDITQWKDKSLWKIYRGMASKDAQVGWRGGEGDDIIAEGESSLVPYKGPFKQVLHQLLGGLSSGMSYVGAKSLTQLHDKAKFVRVSPNTLTENTAHGKM